MTLADSILQTASMALCESAADTATDHTTFNPPMQERLLVLQLSPDTFFVLDLFFGQDRGEVFHLKDVANLDL